MERGRACGTGRRAAHPSVAADLVEITDEVSARGSARAFWHESHPVGLFEDGDSGALDDAARDISAWRSTNLGFLTFRDGDYPAQLREIHEMPPVLFHLGKWLPGEAGVSVVGSRQASARGPAIAHAVATGLADRDITVIAGLAKGIDTAAHQAARPASTAVLESRHARRSGTADR